MNIEEIIKHIEENIEKNKQSVSITEFGSGKLSGRIEVYKEVYELLAGYIEKKTLRIRLAGLLNSFKIIRGK